VRESLGSQDLNFIEDCDFRVVSEVFEDATAFGVHQKVVGHFDGLRMPANGAARTASSCFLLAKALLLLRVQFLQ
jgi:hypothetical protein